MRKKPSQYLLLILLLFCLATCKKSDKDARSKDKSTFKRSVTAAISQPSENQLTYEPTSVGAEIDVLTIQYDPNLHVVNSSISLNENAASFSYTLSFNDPVWKVNQDDQINQKVTALSNYNVSLTEVQNSLAELEAVMESVKNTASDAILYSLSINISILKTLERKLNDPNDCNCTVHPAFLAGKSYFGCQEDLFYNRADLINIMNQYESEFGSDSETNNIKAYALSYSNNEIPFKSIYSLMFSAQDYEEFITNARINGDNGCPWWCRLGCANEHGCCGNYLGCCVFKHKLCYIHDKICNLTSCQPTWFCLPGCKPGSGIIPDPAEDTTGSGNPGGGGSNPPITTYPVSDLWNYLNVVKAWYNNDSGLPTPTVLTSGDVIYMINLFVAAAPSTYAVPTNAWESDFITQAKSFVNGSYMSMPGASDPMPTPFPEDPTPTEP